MLISKAQASVGYLPSVGHPAFSDEHSTSSKISSCMPFPAVESMLAQSSMDNMPLGQTLLSRTEPSSIWQGDKPLLVGCILPGAHILVCKRLRNSNSRLVTSTAAESTSSFYQYITDAMTRRRYDTELYLLNHFNPAVGLGLCYTHQCVSLFLCCVIKHTRALVHISRDLCQQQMSLKSRR